MMNKLNAQNSYCMYYQAVVDKPNAWFMVAVLRGFEHCTFDRTFDKERSIFEFFVPEAFEQFFIGFMDYCKKEGIVFSYEKLPNRLLNPDEVV